MPDIVFAAIRFAFLLILWIFVFAVVAVVRRDLFVGTRSGRLVAAPRGISTGTGLVPRVARVKKGKAAHYLVVTEGSLAGTRITLTDSPVTVGRSEDSTVVITDDYASARHARLFPQDGQWFIEDQGSTNGTYLDRARVTGRIPVPLGVPIRIGRTAIELRS